MKIHNPTVITDSNLSFAWARAFLHVLDTDDNACLAVAIRDFTSDLPPKDAGIGETLNAFLRDSEPPIPTIEQTALTIVPYERWIRMNKPTLEVIRAWYLDQYLPRLKARCSKNRHGTYFERLVNYSGIKFVDGKPELREVDQLAHVLEIWRRAGDKGKRPRQSALQLACFDPAKDHTGAALSGFPCLQQVSLTYKEAGTLEINAYYPTQYMLERAYGNYLGLCQLGHFIAHQMGVRLTAFTCFVGNPELGNANKSEVAQLASYLRKRLQQAAGERAGQAVLQK
jgi:hypothetical protein